MLKVHPKLTIVLSNPPGTYLVTQKSPLGWFDEVSREKGLFIIASRADVSRIHRLHHAENAQFIIDDHILSEDELREFLFFVEMQFEDLE
jgi:hypothetical protein